MNTQNNAPTAPAAVNSTPKDNIVAGEHKAEQTKTEPVAAPAVAPAVKS